MMDTGTIGEKKNADIWLEEYKILRSELEKIIITRYQVFSISLSVLGLTMTLSKQKSFEDLLLLLSSVGLLIIPSFTYVIYCLSAQFHRITAYLQVFIEPELKLQREKAWDLYHEKFRPKSYTYPLMVINATILLLITLIPSIYYFSSSQERFYCLSNLANLFGDFKSCVLSNAAALSIFESIAGAIFSVIILIKWRAANIRNYAIANWERIKLDLNNKDGHPDRSEGINIE